MYPGGVTVDDVGHDAQLARTRALLERDEVTIYEAALEAGGLFVVRVDILRKRGDQLELIEVTAKYYDPHEDGDFRGAKGQIKAEYLHYLQDIAFQRHAAALPYPLFQYRCFLMMADKSVVATVDWLNQRFRVRRNHGTAAVPCKTKGANPLRIAPSSQHPPFSRRTRRRHLNLKFAR
jgi:hypothetical protein